MVGKINTLARKQRNANEKPHSEYDKKEALKNELCQIMEIKISYLAQGIRIPKPLVHTELLGFRFKTVKVIGKITEIDTITRGHFLFSVDDDTGEIKCIFQKDQILKTKNKYEIYQNRLLKIQRKLAKLRRIYKNQEPPTEKKQKYKEHLKMHELILHRAVRIMKERCLNELLKKDDAVEVTGNVGPWATHPKIIYVKSARKLKSFQHESEYFNNFVENKLESKFGRLKLAGAKYSQPCT